MDDVTNKRTDLLNGVYKLVFLIVRTRNPLKIAEYVDQLNKLKPKLIALGSTKKAA